MSETAQVQLKKSKPNLTEPGANEYLDETCPSSGARAIKGDFQSREKEGKSTV